MSDTPRTDAAEYVQIDGVTTGPLGIIDADFARSLERELAAATERIEAVSSALKRTTSKLNDATQDAAAWRAYAERLEKAGDTLATVTLRNGRSHEQWHAAKETKP